MEVISFLSTFSFIFSFLSMLLPLNGYCLLQALFCPLCCCSHFPHNRSFLRSCLFPLLLLFHCCCSGFSALLPPSLLSLPSSLLLIVSLLLSLIPLLSIATASFCLSCRCCSSQCFHLLLPLFSSTLLLLLSFSSLFLFRILKGTSPSTFRSFCLLPPAPFALSLSLFLASVSSMSILMHIGTSPATCLNFCLPPPFPFFLSFSYSASVFAVF